MRDVPHQRRILQLTANIFYCRRGVSTNSQTICHFKRPPGPERSPQAGGPAAATLEVSSEVRSPDHRHSSTAAETYHSLVPSIRCLTHCHSALSRSALSSWPSPFVVLAPSLRLRGHPLQPHPQLSSRTSTRRSKTPSSPPSRVTVPPPPLSSSAFFLSPFSSSNISYRIFPFPTRISSCAPIPSQK